jgi:CRP-like cAMP-binding protein
VNGGRTLATYREGDTVFSQGDRCDAVFYIRHGNCKVCVLSEHGKEAIVALHEKGDFFGEGCLTGQPLRLATIKAMTELEVMRFELTAMQRALQQEPFSELFIAHLLARAWR